MYEFIIDNFLISMSFVKRTLKNLGKAGLFMSSIVTGDKNNETNFQITENLNINGFTVTNNKATKEIDVDGKKLLLTINFPANLGQKKIENRLNEFNVDKVRAAGLFKLFL